MKKQIRQFQSYLRYLKEFRLFSRLNKNDNRFEVSKRDRMCLIKERTRETSFDRHYIYHTAWAARKLKEINPESHIDISSSIYFCSIVSAFVPVQFFDFRPPALQLNNLIVGQVDLKKMHFQNNSVHSLSCMHVIEHIGLGRYGDTIDVAGDRIAASELMRILAIDGTLMIVVPMGRKRIRFNAHRVYDKDTVLNLFPELKLLEFSFIPDQVQNGHLLINPVSIEGMEGCGCFLLKKEA